MSLASAPALASPCAFLHARYALFSTCMVWMALDMNMVKARERPRAAMYWFASLRYPLCWVSSVALCHAINAAASAAFASRPCLMALSLAYLKLAYPTVSAAVASDLTVRNDAALVTPCMMAPWRNAWSPLMICSSGFAPCCVLAL